MKNPEISESVSESPASARAAFHPLRAWPALLFALAMPAARFGPRLAEDGGSQYWMVSVFGPLLCCVLVILWWLAASRATWRERVFGLLAVVAGAAACMALDPPTMRGPAAMNVTIPLGLFLFALAAALMRKARPAVRSWTAVLLAWAGFSVSLFLRSEGMTGNYQFAFHPRWQPSAEEVMVAARPAETTTGAPPENGAGTEALAHPEWPAFQISHRQKPPVC